MMLKSEPTDRLSVKSYVKGFEFFSFAIKWVKILAKI